MPLPVLIYVLKIGMFQQFGGFGKLQSRRFGLAKSRRSFFGSGVHTDHIRLGSESRGQECPRLDYSRNPGFTATRLRPLARRRDRTAAPLFVFIRLRNPCVLERRRRLG